MRRKKWIKMKIKIIGEGKYNRGGKNRGRKNTKRNIVEKICKGRVDPILL